MVHKMRDHENLEHVLRFHVSPTYEFTNLVVSINEYGMFAVSYINNSIQGIGTTLLEALYQLASNCWCDEVDILSPNG